jgi:hypothetical protein
LPAARDSSRSVVLDACSAGRARRVRADSRPATPDAPDEIEKTLRKLGDDGDKVRGAIERDFAAYAREAEKDRGIAPLLSSTVAKPLLTRAGRAAAEWFFRADDEGFQARLAEVRERAKGEVAKRRSDGPSGPVAGEDDEAERSGA